MSKTIYLRVKGGLGNQLFQYAVAYYLKREFHRDVCIDISYYQLNKLLNNQKRKFDIRNYQLDKFNIESHKTQSNILCLEVDRIVRKFKQGGVDRKISWNMHQ